MRREMLAVLITLVVVIGVLAIYLYGDIGFGTAPVESSPSPAAPANTPSETVTPPSAGGQTQNGTQQP